MIRISKDEYLKVMTFFINTPEFRGTYSVDNLEAQVDISTGDRLITLTLTGNSRTVRIVGKSITSLLAKTREYLMGHAF